ncbi:SdrD B-like domain-containing protein [Leifsonia virtsii]|uniref:SdrD B-like domain-containing protein n=1 Tax=Leifsonia virtsii TaxID=3035915 RepID=A0ABT8IVN8_9MICO|nr:Ig-like domain-containing protein [Leifsonia virtsii]MDN4596860.1 SdrD B-like domain-containing protein [Leifsonia virtsii]
MNSTVLRTAARPIAALVAALLILAGVLAGTTAARAAEIPGAVTSVTTDKSSYGYSERLRLAFTWAVPDGSRPGDTFQLALPDELAAVSLARFPLTAPDGTTVADAVWNGKTVVFTLTDYVASHDAVSGSGYLTVQWDHSVVTETGGPVILRFGTSVSTVTIAPKPQPTPCTTNCGPAPVRTERGLWKGASWADGAYEGTRDPKDNINWTVEVPGDQTGLGGPVDVVDALGAGSVVDCASIRITTRNSLAGGAPTSQLSPYRYTLTCSDTGFHLVIDTVGASEFIDITYKGTITDQSAGNYGNEVTITAPGKTWTKTTTIKRTAAGGVGGGVQSVSVGDYVWLDTDRDGLQGADEKGIAGVVLRLTGPDGGPVTDVNGTPVGPATTDANGHYLFTGLPVLGAGQHYTVSIDRDASSAALSGLLPTVAGAGADRAKDSSTWSAVSASLTTNNASDLTLDFGFVAAVDPTAPNGTNGDPAGPAAPATPTVPGSPAPSPAAVPAGSTETLAHTGSDVTLPLTAGLVLLVLGAAGAVIGAVTGARRRRAG